jgi:endonuclease YncB( thermonuclease family)
MPPGTALLLAGLAIAIDGRTLRIDDQYVRLWGVDAPEASQWCEQADWPHPCGQESWTHLSVLTVGRTTRCTERMRDRWGRMIAVCTTDGVDLGAAMIEAGHAVADVRHGPDYLPQQQRAQAARRGLWDGSFDWPWDWRKQYEPSRAD